MPLKTSLGRINNGAGYAAVEFAGSAVQALSMQERMTLSNMSAELGAQAGLIAPDEVTAAWLRDAGVRDLGDYSHWCTDDGADVDLREFDASALEPSVALPHSPANVSPVSQIARTPVQVAYIGACTGAKLDDLRAAANVLRGRRVDPSVSLMVAPASIKDQQEAEKEGVMKVLVDAGANVFATSCGACSGYGNALRGARNVVSSTARNFKGRMGSDETQVYLASPYTVAASAVAGYIADPRNIMETAA